MLGGKRDEKQQLIRSDQNKTGYKGVAANHGRYNVQCNTAPSHAGGQPVRQSPFSSPQDAQDSQPEPAPKRSKLDSRLENKPQPEVVKEVSAAPAVEGATPDAIKDDTTRAAHEADVAEQAGADAAAPPGSDAEAAVQ